MTVVYNAGMCGTDLCTSLAGTIYAHGDVCVKGFWSERKIGEVDSTGDMYDPEHRLIGQVGKQGRIVLFGKGYVGHVDSRGYVYDHNEGYVGKIASQHIWDTLRGGAALLLLS